MTQCEIILEHLKKYGSITPADAFMRYRIMRLGARIWDLKKQGYPIIAKTEVHTNADGKTSAYSRYCLAQKGVLNGIPGNN